MSYYELSRWFSLIEAVDFIDKKVLIFSHAATPIENPMRIKVARRFVARIKTEINNKALKA